MAPHFFCPLPVFPPLFALPHQREGIICPPDVHERAIWARLKSRTICL
jgi:hypothetical protein